MKFNLKICSLLFLSTLIIACADDDSSTVENNSNYFPLVVGNSWDYQNSIESDENTQTGSETLTISESLESNPERFSFEQSNVELPGTTTSVISAGEVYKEDGQNIIFDSEYELDTGGILDLSLPIENVTIYNSNTNEGDEFYTENGEIEETVNGLPVTISYELISTNGGFMPSMNVEGETYEDIYISELTFDMSISVFFVFNVTVLQDQNVTTVTNYFAKDVGLIKSTVDTELIFEDIPDQVGFQLQDISFYSTQNLIDYQVELDL